MAEALGISLGFHPLLSALAERGFCETGPVSLRQVSGHGQWLRLRSRTFRGLLKKAAIAARFLVGPREGFEALALRLKNLGAEVVRWARRGTRRCQDIGDRQGDD